MERAAALAMIDPPNWRGEWVAPTPAANAPTRRA